MTTAYYITVYISLVICDVGPKSLIRKLASRGFLLKPLKASTSFIITSLLISYGPLRSHVSVLGSYLTKAILSLIITPKYLPHSSLPPAPALYI